LNPIQLRCRQPIKNGKYRKLSEIHPIEDSKLQRSLFELILIKIWLLLAVSCPYDDWVLTYWDSYRFSFLGAWAACLMNLWQLSLSVFIALLWLIVWYFIIWLIIFIVLLFLFGELELLALWSLIYDLVIKWFFNFFSVF